MSMGLRGCTVFVPLCMALWCRRNIKENWVTASIAVSSLLTFVLGVLNMTGAVVLPCDPVFFGVAASLNGYLYTPMNIIMRVIICAGGLSMLVPGIVSDLVGLMLVGFVFTVQYMKGKAAIQA